MKPFAFFGSLSPRFRLLAAGSALFLALGCSSSDDKGAPGGSGGDTPGQTSPSGYPFAPGSGGVPKPSGAPGGLTVLNWAGFTAAASYTFDDTNSSQIAHYAELQSLGARFTFYLITSKPEVNDPVWLQAQADGHEIGNHTKSHNMSDDGTDVDAATAFIEEHFHEPPWTMAAPYGASVYSELAKTRFFINRGVSNGLIGPNDNSDPFSLYCFIPNQDAPADDFNKQMDSALSAGKWRVVLVHGFTGGSDMAYQPVSIDEFMSSVKYTQSLGQVWIDSVVNVGSYWLGQKAVSQATQTTSGDTTTFTWELPDHFPPGKYVRVQVTGGRLEQDGKTIPWDDHGFYEISLDARSLTLSP